MTRQHFFALAMVGSFGMGAFFSTAASAAVVGIDSATFTDSADDMGGTGDDTNEISGDYEDDATTLTSITVGSATFGAIAGPTAATVTGSTNVFEPEDDSPGGGDDNGWGTQTLADASQVGLGIDGVANPSQVDVGFGSDISGTNTLLFIIENIAGLDDITVQGLLDGNLVGSELSIGTDDWGGVLDLDQNRTGHQQYRLDLASGTPVTHDLGGVSFTLADLDATTIDGLRISDGDSSIDPAIVGYVIPEPASLALVGLGSLLMVGGRRRRAA